MLKNLATDAATQIVKQIEVEHCCKNRIKPTMLNGVKTEALLVFARTALERYFKYVKLEKYTPKVGTPEETEYVYKSLKTLEENLVDSVVNAEYLISLVQGAKTNAALKIAAKREEPLINYYDTMVKRVSHHFNDKPAYIPEFLVICILNHWIVEEEHSIELYPFLKEIDFEMLISKFELNRVEFEKDDECIISDIFEVSLGIIKQLKKFKYKANKERVSKTRKKK